MRILNKTNLQRYSHIVGTFALAPPACRVRYLVQHHVFTTVYLRRLKAQQEQITKTTDNLCDNDQLSFDVYLSVVSCSHVLYHSIVTGV